MQLCTQVSLYTYKVHPEEFIMRRMTSTFTRLLPCALLALLVAAGMPLPAAGEELPEHVLETMHKFQNLSPEQREALRVKWESKAATRAPLKATSGFTCLPSCDVTDAKFLAIAGVDLATLSDASLDVTISAPAGTTSLLIGLFDGDGGVVDPLNVPPPGFGDPQTAWDRPSSAAGAPPEDYTYTIYASPLGTTGPETLVLGPIASAGLLNNAWEDFVIDTTVSPGADALAPSGNFIFRLEILRVGAAAPNAINVFKVRTDGVASIRLGEQPFSYISNFNNTDDFITVYPNLLVDGTTTLTSYDGDWSFFFDVAEGQEELLVWDGDFDFGRFDGDRTGCLPLAPAAQRACLLAEGQDTNDADTPDAPFLPLFPITGDAVSEAVGAGFSLTSGDPPDDVDIPTGFDFFVRQPSVRYDVVFPDGRSFASENPSGNLEWEQFRVSTQAGCDPDPLCVPTGTPSGANDPVGGLCADACLAPVPGQIPAGVYEASINGVDAFNLNALRLPQILCIDASGAPCDPLRTFQLGDTVFSDSDGDGVQTGGEPGIQGVIVNLLGPTGGFAGSTITDASGNYSFDVDRGTFSVQVAPENFATAPVGAVGDRVYFDLDGDGTDDGGTDPGLANVQLILYEDGADNTVGTLDDEFRAATKTDANGNYRFADLPDGTYYVDVIDGSVPAGLTLTQGPDPSATAAIAANEDLTLDFGYTPTLGALGDFVWIDADGAGDQDAGEVGIGGVTVNLFDSGANLVATTETGADGFYLFTGLAADTYTVSVDTSTVPAGLAASFDLDGGLDSTASRALAAGELALDVDFGYTSASLFSITDSVWIDTARNAVRDGGDPGITGVTVNLLDGVGNVIATTVTGAGGVFSFTGLPDGAYSLAITDTAGVLDAFGPGLVNLVPTTQPAVEGIFDVVIAGADVVNDTFGYNETPVLAGLVGTTLENPVPNTEQQLDVVPIGPGDDENNPNYDFGYLAPGSLGDRVWFDVDGDTTDNGGSEPGIAGVTVTLTNVATGQVETTMTDSNGFYSFTGLRPTNSGLAGDVYVVTVDDSTLPAGFTVQTFDLDGTGTPDTADASLGTQAPGIAEDRVDVDFGYRGTGSIGDRVWNDANGDQDQTGEAGINGVTVELLDSTGAVIATDVTSGDGNYLFDGLPPGDYTVRVVRPAGFAQTFDLDGTLDDETSVTLGLGENRTDVDFGYQQVNLEGSLGDRVWNDIDGDGVQDAGEAGINDVTVQLFDAGGGLVATDVTSGDGDYSFPGLTAGTYTVVVDDTTLPEGFVQTFDIEGPLDHTATVNLNPGEDRVDVDFGYADECLPFIDFDTDGAGAGLSKGTVIDNQWAAFGVTVSTGDPSHLPMIFDSSNPTGGDADLGTPNETFGGPGIGSGGEAGQPGQNAVALGNVLIISEDNDSSDPDDNAGGGTITFDFAYPVRVDKVGILDIDEGAGGTVTAFDGSGATIGSAAMANNLGNNSVQTVLLGVSGVRRLEVFFPGSGAVSEVIFCEPENECSPVQVRDNFETSSFSNNDGADAWSGDWIENDPEAGGAGPSAGQVQVHGGLLTLDDYPNTGGHPSAAREVDLSGAASATLNFKFATSHGVDPGDAVTVEVSSDGGATWSTLEVITGISGAVQQNRSFDISAFASSETQVRFRVSKYYGGENELFCLLFVEIVSSCDTCQEIEVRDNFETSSFSNNDGADAWSGDWIENDPEAGGAGPSAGQVQVHNGLLTLDDYPNTGGHPSAAREVDLTGAENATLSFTFATSSGVDTSDAVTVEISNDGGATWSTLEVITGIHGAVQKNRSYDISAFISSETQVRFRVSKYYGGSNELFCVLYVEIKSDCDGGSTGGGPTGGGAQDAVYDSSLGAPACAGVGSECDSVALLDGRAGLGPESNAPNTIDGCTDGSAGSYHYDESNDRIVVKTLDGSDFAPGKTVKIKATVWAYSQHDYLDLYYAADANNPTWVYITSISPSAAGAQTLSAQYTLPAGGLQAVRANFNYDGDLAACPTGPYDDADDLVFAVSAP